MKVKMGMAICCVVLLLAANNSVTCGSAGRGGIAWTVSRYVSKALEHCEGVDAGGSGRHAGGVL